MGWEKGIPLALNRYVHHMLTSQVCIGGRSCQWHSVEPGFEQLTVEEMAGLEEGE